MNTTTVVKALVGRREELQNELRSVDLALEAFNAGRATGRAVTARSRPRKARRVMDEATRAKISKKMRRNWSLKKAAKKA